MNLCIRQLAAPTSVCALRRAKHKQTEATIFVAASKLIVAIKHLCNVIELICRHV